MDLQVARVHQRRQPRVDQRPLGRHIQAEQPVALVGERPGHAQQHAQGQGRGQRIERAQ